MKFEFFTIPAFDSHAAQTELNQFCAQHRVASVEKQFVANACDTLKIRVNHLRYRF